LIVSEQKAALYILTYHKVL